MLPNDRVVRQVLFDAGLAKRMTPGTLAIDMGTSAPSAKHHEEFRPRRMGQHPHKEITGHA
jgi:3-hydroxyisobutyrate dehydrogenase-like beta-hydroxyacid dehydrogenase